jgi:hypothetical protein
VKWRADGQNMRWRWVFGVQCRAVADWWSGLSGYVWDCGVYRATGGISDGIGDCIGG